MARWFLVVFALLLLGSSLPADQLDAEEQWPHWRGPRKTGEAPRATPPLRWDASTNVAWKTELPGRGASTPIVWGDRIFLLSAVDSGRKASPQDLPKPDPRFEKKTNPPQTYHRFLVLALDRRTGKMVWQKTATERVPHEGHHFSHSYAAGSPMTDGQRLYVSFGSFGVYCYDLEGQLLWSRDLGRMETRLGWGEASHPVVHGDRVFLTWDHEGDSFLICLDAKTGKTLWKVDRDEPSSWATPLVVSHKNRTQIITPGTNKVRSYDATNGKILWTSEGLTINCIPSPVAHQGVVFVMAGYRKSIASAISLDASGEVTGSEKLLWTISRGTPYVPSPVLVGDRLYFTQTNEPILSSVDVKTGKIILDRARLHGISTIYASPLAAQGKIYITGREGTTVVLKQGDKGEVLAVNRLGEGVDASPVAVGKQLLLRGEKHLWCFMDR